jgi:hypothetical protein
VIVPVYALAPCVSCHRLFVFDIDRVPSTWYGPPRNQRREPLCRHCVTVANERRRIAGRPLIDVPAGAYPDVGP